MIDIFVQSRYQVHRKKLRDRMVAFLKKVGVDAATYTVSIAIIGDRKMRMLHEKFRGKKGTTPVLSFPLMETAPRVSRTSVITAHIRGRQKAPKGADIHAGKMLLGEIVISYPQALIFASDENKLVDDKIGEFAEHGLANLLRAG